jgi:hypothetical protein
MIVLKSITFRTSEINAHEPSKPERQQHTTCSAKR